MTLTVRQQWLNDCDIEAGNPPRFIELEAGRFYENGRGDVCGPMEERTPGVWLDQHGGLYHPDGTQWNHVPDSTGNLSEEIEKCPTPDQ